MNLAAIHRDDVRDKSEYQRTNVNGAENVARVCEEKKLIRIVFISTVAVYGSVEPGTDESGVINPFNEYMDGLKPRRICGLGTPKGNNSLIIVRPTVIFGEGNRKCVQFVEPDCIRKIPDDCSGENKSRRGLYRQCRCLCGSMSFNEAKIWFV